MIRGKKCKKCNNDDWGIWTSSTTGIKHYYCRSCRRLRAKNYTHRKQISEGSHTEKQWLEKLREYDHCAICNEKWENIPPRPDRRYKNVWTKDHIIPLTKGGTDDINNIQPACYRCNSSKCDKI